MVEELDWRPELQIFCTKENFYVCGVVDLNSEHVIHAERERIGSLTVTLLDGRDIALVNDDAEDVWKRCVYRRTTIARLE